MLKCSMSLVKQELKLIRPALASPWPYVLTVAAMVWAALHFGPTPAALAGSGVFAFLLSLQSVIDIRTRQLPHALNALLALGGLLLAHPHLTSSLLGAAAFFISFLLMAMLAQKIAKKQALGGGDLYLVAALGTWLGAASLPPYLLILAVVSLAFLTYGRLTGAKTGRFAFGPLLAAAGWLTLLYQGLYWACIRSLLV